LGESSGNFSFIALVHTTISVTNVVATNDQYATEMAHLHARAAECRLRVVDSQLSLGFTLCAIAETEIIYAQYDEARKMVQKVRRHVETIRISIDAPNHLPTIAIADLRLQVTQLEKRTEEIESRLRQRLT